MNHSTHQIDNPLNLDADTAQRDARLGQQPIKASLPCAISSETLLRGQPSVTIAHQGAIYRLQTTRQGKLILTK
jgi:hemin uptake protein HemP